MHTIEVLEQAIAQAKRLGFGVRSEWLGGSGGGDCETGCRAPQADGVREPHPPASRGDQQDGDDPHDPPHPGARAFDGALREPRSDEPHDDKDDPARGDESAGKFRHLCQYSVRASTLLMTAISSAASDAASG